MNMNIILSLGIIFLSIGLILINLQIKSLRKRMSDLERNFISAQSTVAFMEHLREKARENNSAVAQ